MTSSFLVETQSGVALRVEAESVQVTVAGHEVLVMAPSDRFRGQDAEVLVVAVRCDDRRQWLSVTQPVAEDRAASGE
jgi:hypothetical protein